MSYKTKTPETPPEKLVRDIRRVTRKQYWAEEKIRIVLNGLRGEKPDEVSYDACSPRKPRITRRSCKGL